MQTLSLIYAIIAMVFGVFYREFTKLSGFSGETALSVMHTHYFMLGMFFFLALLLMEKAFAFSDARTKKLLIVYQVGLNVSSLGFLMRGLTQILVPTLSSGLDASISGVSGIGHILMGVTIVMLLLQIKKRVA